MMQSLRYNSESLEAMLKADKKRRWGNATGDCRHYEEGEEEVGVVVAVAAHHSSAACWERQPA